MPSFAILLVYSLVQDVAQKTNELAGDGTTTVDNSATGNAAGTKSTTTTGKTTKNAR